MDEMWPTVTLGDVAEITSSKRIKMADYVESGVPFYRAKEIIELSKGNNISTELFITEDYFSSIDQKFGSPSQGDILLTSVGTLGVPYQVKEDDRFYFKDGNLTWFRNYKPNIDNKFLLCWLTSSIAKRRFDEITIGSTQKALTIVALKSIKIVLPPITEQTAIASVLGALDDKIENNQRMNETLEEMARAIFKSWFVDFDPVHAKASSNAPAHMDADTAALFTNSFGDNGLPVGWANKTLGDFCKITSGKRPPTKMTAPDNENKISVYGGNGIAWYTNQVLFEPPFMITGRVGTLGTVYRVYEKCWVSDNALCCFPNNEDALELIYFAMKEIDYQSLNSGSTQPLLTQTTLKAQNIVAPSKEVASAFHQKTKILFKKVLANNKENKTLAELRDTLLPKLMSGEIRVKDGERAVEAAV